MDDVVFVFNKEDEKACAFTIALYQSLRQWLGVTCREPKPKERQGFEVKAPNVVVVVTPNVMLNEQVKEAIEAAVGGKRNLVFLHHIRSICNLEEEVRKCPEECLKVIDKTLKEKHDHAGGVVVYADDLSVECNDMLMKKLKVKDPGSLQEAFDKRCSETNINIMKFSARVSKARSLAGQKRKYDLCITAASKDISPDGMPVLVNIFDTITKLAPALSVGRNHGDKVTNANVMQSFNLIVVLTKDAFTCPSLQEEIQTSLENEGTILIVHHLASCPNIQDEFSKCENQVLATSLIRSARFTYLEEAVTSVVAAILEPGTVKADDTKTPPTRRALQGGGGKMASFRLEYKNNFALGVQGDGTGQVYNSKFNDKKKDLPPDIDASINELFKLFAGDAESMKWPQFAEVDRIVTECLGGQYSEMISRRAFSMMNYPGLTLEYEITKTTFKNYHYFVAKSMGALEGDRDANVHYKYIVDKVKTAKGAKRFKTKSYDLFVTHDRSKDSAAFALKVRASIDKHTPNIRCVICTDKIAGKEKQEPVVTAASSHNVLVLLQEDCLKNKDVQEEILAGAREGAQIMVMCNIDKCPMLEREIKKSSPEVQSFMARPSVVEYWESCDATCCIKLLELLAFPQDANSKRPAPNKEVTFRKRDNAAVLYFYRQCDEDTEAAEAFQTLANMVSPSCRSACSSSEAFLRDGGLEILQERLSQYTAVGSVQEAGCRSVASLAQYTPAARRMAELGVVKTLVEAMQAHGDNGPLQGEACRALVNLAQDDLAKSKINECGGFQLMLQSQKKFEYDPEFWDMRWGIKKMEPDDEVMVNYRGLGRWCSAQILSANKGNGTYDVSYHHGGMDRRVPAQWVRPKDKSDAVMEFVATWQWKPNGKNTEDELTLKADGMLLYLKSQGTFSAGTWSMVERKPGGRNCIKLSFSQSDLLIDMERISLTTLRSTSSPHRAVLKDENEDCLFASYYSFKEGVLEEKTPSLLGRKPDIVRTEQQMDWVQTKDPWIGLPSNFKENYATCWRGLLEITKMGEYTFKLQAATGARMWLNDKLINDVPNDKEGEVKINLLGGQHRMRVEYFCKSQDKRMINLSYMGPDTAEEEEVITVPVAVFQHSKEEYTLVPKPGFIAEYFPEEYEAGCIPEGVEPDIMRIEKQLDFEDSEPWQGLPQRYLNAFAARYTTYITVSCGGAKKAKYTFKLTSGKCGKLYINDELVSQEDAPTEIELKKGSHLVRVDCFCKKHTGEQRVLRLTYSGPESGTKELPPAQEGGDPILEPLEIIIPPTVTGSYLLPSFAISKGGPLLRHEKSVVLTLWSNRDSRIASVGQGGKMFLWDPPTGFFLSEMDCQSTVTCGVMGKGPLVALALDDPDHSIKIIDFEKESEVRSLIHQSAGKEEVEEGEEEPLLSHEKRVNAVAFNHDDSICASGSEDGILKFWEVATGQELSTIPLRAPKTDEEIAILSLAFTGDGKYLLSGGKEKCIRIWITATGDTLRGPDIKIPNEEPEEGWPDGVEPEEKTKPGDPITLEGHGAPVVCIKFSPKSATRFASCSTDATIRIWDLAVEQHTATLTDAIDPIQCLTPFVTWSPDAATLVSSTEDIYVQLWSAVTGKPRCEPLRGHTATVKSSAWAPSGQAFVTCAEDNSVRMWHFLINRNIVEIAELEEEQMVFNSDMRKWATQLSHIRFDFTKYDMALAAYEPEIYALRKALDQGKERTQSFVARERLLGLAVTDYFELDGMIDDYAPYYKLWDMVINFQKKEITWTNDPVKSLEAEEIENLIDSWYKEVYKMIKAFDNDNMRSIHTIAKNMRAGIEDFKIRFPFLRAYANVSTKPRHWDTLFERMKIDRMADYDNITLKMMLDVNILEFTDDFEELSTAAMKEHTLKKMMESMMHDWEPLSFDTNERNGAYLLKGIDEIQSVLDDHITKTQGIRSNPFCKPFEADIHKWEATLLYIQDFIDQTVLLQRAWMSLEPIFVSDDIKKQLPNESASFENVDKIFRKRMNDVNDIKNCIKISQMENIVEDMKESNETVERVQKGLKDYLETKRLYFPRFFFLNDADLLSILAETKDPTLVQPHMGKAFEGIAKVRFDKSNEIIEAMISAEGESVDFKVTVNVNKEGNKGAVEKWLLEVEETMMDTLRAVTKTSNDAYPTAERPKWCCEFPGQVVLATDCIYWTSEVETALKAGQIADYERKLFSQLSDIVSLVRGEMTKLNRVTVGAMVTIDVHARDVVTDLVQQKVDSVQDFAWLQQLRYYWQDVGTFDRVDTQKPNTKMECKVAIVNSVLLYGFEYLGNSARLVITPLTDRCYRTLMGAFALYYGGAPEGPAGTGKTESTKDLAKALAIQCVVFNCSDSMDYLQLAKFFKGLASSGSWCCFDEFNRISLEVLSVVAQQIQQISIAIKRRVDKFVFEDTTIRLVTTCAVNITMNPGYAGRSELPDNLKALFRPCAMMVPNYALIAEIRLYSFGYEDARRIGTKATIALKLSSEQLSPQKHYDFGMRGLNALLVAGGNGKRNMGDRYPEDTIALRSFTDVNMPKFTTADIPLFKGIIGDLFPGVELPPSDMGKLVEKMGEIAIKNGLQAAEPFLQKTVQLWETVLVRHGLMIVGIPPCGKTNVKNTLAETLEAVADGGDSYMPVTQYVMNPKSILQGQLYGESDINTQEWTDGVLAIAVRSAANAYGDGRRQWVVLDGPVDAIWIENMNTVLDDNKKLCLNSGEIIKLSVVTTMLFEVRDLDYASPATVSRVGIVFLEPDSDLGWQPMFASWLDKLPEYIVKEHKQQIYDLFHGYFEVMLECTDRVRTPFPVSHGWLCSMACRLMESLMNDQNEKYCKETVVLPEGQEPEEDQDMGQTFEEREMIIVQLFWFTMVWTCGACTDADGRQFICDVIRSMIDKKKDFIKKHNFVADFEVVEMTGGGPAPPAPPRKALLHDVYVDGGEGGKWKPWTDRIMNTDIPKDAAYHTIIVPTSDTERNQFIIRTLIESKYNVLLSGPTGTAKTASIASMLLQGFDPSLYNTISFAFSAQTTANQTQDVIDGKLDKRKKGTFGPPVGKKMLVFIDDLNMPFKEEYGAQPPIEILRQMFILTPLGMGWYDRRSISWDFRQIIDTHMLAAMCPPGGGKNDITDRYSRHFNLVFVIPFDDESLNRIFTTVVNKFMVVMSRDVAGNAASAVTATLEIYNTVLKELLPTPAKSHYTFNMRDVSKVFQGICQCTRESLPKIEDLIKVWWHESERVFKDRLTVKQDLMWFTNLLKRQMGKHFKKEYESVIKLEPVIFVDFVDPKSSSYMECLDHGKLNEKVTECLEDYNSVSKIRMDLVLFTAFIQHVCRVVRVLRLPLGNALLVGVGGSGRKATTTLATYVAQFELFQIEMSKGYGMTEWHDDMKRVLMRAGCDDLNVVFLFSDTQIAKEAFLEEVSSILNTGEVPNLFASEDKLEITERCSKGANAVGKNGPAEIFAWFVEQIRKNLHIVIAMSPIGAIFRNRLRSFPSLVNCCTIDWFHEWPADALTAVANQFLTKDRDIDLQQKLCDSVVKVMVQAQMTVFELAERFLLDLKRHYYVTPTSYLELINSFISTLKQRRGMVSKAKWRYDTGLEKIADAKEQVQLLQGELNDLEPVLEKAAQETGEMKLRVESEQAAAVEQKTQVAAEEEAANEKKATASVIKADCENDLAAAMPAYEAAVDALSKLSKGDVGEVRGMKTPPDGVVLTTQAMCIMFEVKPVRETGPDGKTKVDNFWEAAKKELLVDPRLLDRMVNYDKDNIPDEVIRKVMPMYLDERFEPDKIKKASLAAMGICKWVRAMVVYNSVAKEVGPKKLKLAGAEKEVADAEATVALKQQELAEVMAKVAELEAQLAHANAQAKELRTKQMDCVAKLRRAEKLMDGLGGEQATWSKKSKDLEKDYTNLTGDILVASGIIAYLGIFTSAFRNEAIQKWLTSLQTLQIPASKEFDLQRCIGDPVKIRQWVIDYLPNDQLSIDNAIIQANSRRWPLMIDPQMQANKWVKKSNDNLKILRLNMRYIPELENSIQFGHPVLIENIEEALDSILDPVLQKATFKQGNMEMIRLGDSTIEWSKDFRLFITTKLPNPHFPPEICVAVGILNFMATLDGLQDQMLNILVAKEEPATEEKRVTLVIESARAKAQLKDCEDKILALLSASTGNILDDENLIETLSNSKITGSKVEEQIKQQEITQNLIADVRQVYKGLALKCAALFFIVGDLCIVDPMYQFSLDWFIKMFNQSIDRAEEKESKEERFAELFRSFIQLLYVMVNRSLFEKDKLLYAVMLTLKVQEMDHELKLNEVMALLTGLPGHAKEEKPANTEWLTQVSWTKINCLQALGGFFDGFVGEFTANLPGWKEVFDSDDVFAVDWPNNFKMKTNPLQRALLCFALRADQTVKALQDVVEAKLTRFFLEPPPLELEVCYKDSDPATPLIYILAMGSDPMNDIQRLAESLDMLSKIVPISLGQGQGPKAIAGIKGGGKNGEWVLLQNCHLAPSFMATLETLCEDLDPAALHENFRLWLTACPSPAFPISILQNGVKMTIEPPKGLKQALMRAYLSIDEQWFEESSKPFEFKKMCYGLCFFHGLILERRGFGPVGWNIAYGFSEPDRDISRQQLKAFLEDFKDGVPYEALNYMVAEANYGGRVTDMQDRRCIVTILKDYYTPKILDPEYKFSISGIYYSPEPGPLSSYFDFIRSLPMSTTPEVFWLHNNANLTAAINEGLYLLKTAVTLMASFGASTQAADDDEENVKQKTNEEIFSDIAKEVGEKLPDAVDVPGIMRKYPVQYEQCLNVVLHMELGKFNRLLNKIKSTCINLQKAVKGLVVFSPELEAVGEGCLTNIIPKPWMSVSYPSLKPMGSYVDDFHSRWKFMSTWCRDGIPYMFWFSAYFFQQAFLTGVLQNFARKDKIAIDRCTWNYEVLAANYTNEDHPEKGAIIYGLFMDGARWDDDNRWVEDSFPKVLWSTMSPMWLKPIDIDQDSADPEKVYQCPIYKTSDRKGVLSTSGHSSNFIMYVAIAHSCTGYHSEAFWTKRGVALISQTDD